MLPDPDDGPPGVGEGLVDVAVALGVGRELRDPVAGVRLWDVLVVRASVPEASVDDVDLPPGEDDVGPDAHRPGSQQVVLPVPVAPTVEGRPDPHLWLGPGPPVRLADLGGRIVRRLGVGDDPTPAEVDRAAALQRGRVLVGLAASAVKLSQGLGVLGG